MKVKSESEVAQSCPTLSDPMDCSLPGSSIHGIFQARVLEWCAIAFSTETVLFSYKCCFEKKRFRNFFSMYVIQGIGFALSFLFSQGNLLSKQRAEEALLKDTGESVL